MKKMKTIAALLLTTALVLSAVGCGEQDGSKIQDSSSSDSTATTSSEATESKGTEAVSAYSSQTLPIVPEGEEKTLTMYVRMNSSTAKPEETWFYNFIEEVMNINLEITPFNSENASEFLSLAFADGDLPDIIIGGNFTAQELMTYGAGEGMLMDLAPYINETYMPNLAAIYEENPDYKKAVTDADGHVWSLGSVMSDANIEQVDRMFINYDLIEGLGMEVPTTLDEFLQVMRTIKEEHPDYYPVGGSVATYNPTEFLLNAFGYLNAGTGTSVCLRNGEVVYPVADREAYGAFLEFMHTLYEEELMHPEFYTMTAEATRTMLIENKTALWQGAPFSWTEQYSDWWGVTPLTSDYNDTAQWPSSAGALSCGGAIVSADTEEIELICAFLDWFYTWDGYRTSTNGANADLHPDWLLEEWGGWKSVNNNTIHIDVENNPEKWASSSEYVSNAVHMWSYFTIGFTEDDGSYGDVAPSNYNFIQSQDYSREADDLRLDPSITENGFVHFMVGLADVTCQYIAEENFPTKVYISAEETERANELKNALDLYATTETAKFITGQRSLDELDAYFDEMERLGAEEYVQIYKDYYESMQ